MNASSFSHLKREGAGTAVALVGCITPRPGLSQETPIMNLSRSLALVTFVLVPGSFACGAKGTSSSAATSGSEVAVSTVSGALNKNSSAGAAVGVHGSVQKKSLLDKGRSLFELEGTAHAASWSCSGANLSPSFSGPASSPYAF